MWRSLPILALVACDPVSPGGPPPGAPPAPSSTPAPAAPAAPGSKVEVAALFDEAMRAELDGDALEARDRWIRLAAAAPDTPQGRYATQAAAGADGTVLFVSLGALAGLGTMMWGISEAFASVPLAVDEPRAQLGVMAEAAIAWRQGPGEGRRFFERTELTPDRSACREGLQVPHGPEAFQGPAWQALDFTINQSFLYQYQYVAVPDGPQAGFTVRALGDLDCDGVFSTYERVGVVNPAGEVEVSEVKVVNDQE